MPHAYVPFRLLPAPARSDWWSKEIRCVGKRNLTGEHRPWIDVSSLSGGRWSIRSKRRELIAVRPRLGGFG